MDIGCHHLHVTEVIEYDALQRTVPRKWNVWVLVASLLGVSVSRCGCACGKRMGDDFMKKSSELEDFLAAGALGRGP